MAQAKEAAAQTTRRRGRPPKGSGSKDGTRESIVAVALKLFYEKGFEHTSLSEIARTVGMDPSTMYYYFPSKVALLESFFNPRDLAPSIHALERLATGRAAQLYALIVHDVTRKCELPFDFIEMETVANAEPDDFAVFFESYRDFYQTLVKMIDLGIEEGEFKRCKADERAVTILSVNEGLQHHYHAKHRSQLILEVSGYTVRDYTPEDIGHLSAQAIMPSLLADPALFDEIAQEGRRVFRLLHEADKSRS